jgi:dolichyl-phosphate beta-glucosyltransferase
MGIGAPRIIMVIPCYNEANRLRKELLTDFIRYNEEITMLFVNDGSKDHTLEVLRNICSENPGRLYLLDLPENLGKAEAVRLGFIEAFLMEPAFVGMWDADLSTPLDEVIYFLEVLTNNDNIFLVMGSRVKLLGRSIRRSGLRHILGRLSATLISFTLELEVYDTQCGAKLFRVNDLTKDIFSRPFQSTWLFDVELIARIIKANSDTPDRLIYEFPLKEWTDIAGSKIRLSHYFKSLVELIRIRRSYF